MKASRVSTASVSGASTTVLQRGPSCISRAALLRSAPAPRIFASCPRKNAFCPRRVRPYPGRGAGVREGAPVWGRVWGKARATQEGAVIATLLHNGIDFLLWGGASKRTNKRKKVWTPPPLSWFTRFCKVNGASDRGAALPLFCDKGLAPFVHHGRWPATIAEKKVLHRPPLSWFTPLCKVNDRRDGPPPAIAYHKAAHLGGEPTRASSTRATKLVAGDCVRGTQ